MTSRKLINTLTIPLRWLDLDAYAHVGNSRFYDFMTDARVAVWAESLFTNTSKQYVVVESGCTFKKPLHYPGEVIIKQYCNEVGNSSIHLQYEFFAASAPDILCAEGFAVIVCYDPKLQRAVRVPEEIREKLVSS